MFLIEEIIQNYKLISFVFANKNSHRLMLYIKPIGNNMKKEKKKMINLVTIETQAGTC